jgi:uncharacterized DUF497 family protein
MRSTSNSGFMQRMFERSISYQDVKAVLKTGTVIEDYADDRPYPSRLVLGFVNGRALHVVVATNAQDNLEIVITVYAPSGDVWESDLKRRRK